MIQIRTYYTFVCLNNNVYKNFTEQDVYSPLDFQLTAL